MLKQRRLENVHPAARQALLRPFRLEHENGRGAAVGENVGTEIGTIVGEAVDAVADVGELVGVGAVGVVAPSGVGAPPQSK
jgi:hypothetical protein